MNSIPRSRVSAGAAAPGPISRCAGTCASGCCASNRRSSGSKTKAS